MSDATVTIIVALISGGLVSGVFTLINKLIDRHSSKGDRLSSIEKKCNKNEQDLVRLQMLVMMSDYPDDTNEILTLAEHYFKDLGGNFYMDALFAKWLKKTGLPMPSWFKQK